MTADGSNESGSAEQLTEQEIAEALKVARELIDAGIPVFAAAPNPDRPGQYYLPKEWEKTEPDPAWIDRWRPGWALGAVGGGPADFLDFDPRNGGDQSLRELEIQGQVPRVFGVQASPSGGTHLVISPTGERKATGFMPGVDLQAGAWEPDEFGGHGRGFIYIAPTVRPSKAPETLGQLRPYRWTQVPDLTYLAEFGRGADDTLSGVIARVHASRKSARNSGATRPDLHATHATLGGLQSSDPLFSYGNGVRSFTLSEAQAFCVPHLDALEKAQIGSIEESANRAAVALAHFVPAHWSADTAFDVLMVALGKTAYDPTHPASGWTAEKFRAVLDGRRASADGWKAVRRITTEEALAGAATPSELHESGATSMQPVGRLRRSMYSRSRMRELPEPVPLIEGVIWRDSVTVLSGKFGTYKSFVAVDWACSLATGTAWFEHKVPEAVPVLYAAAEGAYGIRRRIDAWEAHHRVTVPDTFSLIGVPARLNRAEDVAELAEIVQEVGAQVIVFDTLHMSTPGVDENDSGQMGAVMDVLRELANRFGVASILPHHTGHAGERSRGSSSVEDDADTSFVIRMDGEDRGPSNIRTLVHRKAKDAALLPAVPLHLQVVEGTGSAIVRPANAFEAAAGGEDPNWERPEMSLPKMISTVLSEHGHERGLTKTEVRSVVVERFYGGVTARLPKGTWHGGWNRALLDPSIVNVGGERFSADPLVIASVAIDVSN